MIAFNVPDMTCGACADRIGKALAQAGLPAGQQVEIDLAARQVRAPFAMQPEVAQTVQNAIEGAGYAALPAAHMQAASSGKRKGSCCCAPRRASTVDVDQGQHAPTAGCCG